MAAPPRRWRRGRCSNTLTSSHAPATRVLGTVAAGAPATPEAVEEGVQWLTGGAQPGQSLLFLFVGTCADPAVTNTASFVCEDPALAAAGRAPPLLVGSVLRQRLIDALPAGVRLIAVIDCGGRGVPFDIPYTVSPRPPPQHGFEFATCAEQGRRDGGQALLISARAPAPAGDGDGGGAGALEPGVLVHAAVAALARAPRHRLKELLCALRTELGRRCASGAQPPLPFIGSNRPFHPDTVVELG